MSGGWLNLFLKFSGYSFSLKQKIIQADSWVVIVPYALLLIVSELGFTIVSLPVYILVPPDRIQEDGFIASKKIKSRERSSIQTYSVRRKISLTTFFGAGGVFLLKVLFVGIVSFYLLGIQQLLADTQDWTFDTPSDYTYNSAKVEVTGGVARLKDIGSTYSGVTTNSGFDSDATGWTYADWGQGGGEVNITGARVSSGGNPGGWVNISAPAGSGDELGGYWRQGFTTTVANPTTTVSFNYQVSAYDSTPNPVTFKLYVFIDTGTGVPTIGQEVWSSGEITATQGWTSVSNLDVSSKVTAAGTYYLKVAVWLETPGSTAGPYTIGYDNIQLNWSKTTHSYASDSPTTTPVASLTMPKTVSWNSFTETATKNGGEIYYQLSPDNGSNWWYYNGSSWATTTSITNYNTATVINTSISNFTTSTNQIKWRAYLVGNGSQQVTLDNISIGYTQNQRPQVQNLLPAQSTSTGLLNVNYNLQDTESDPGSLTAYEYSLTGAFAGEQVTMAASTTDPLHSGTNGLTAAPAGVGHTFVWDARSQLGDVYTTAYVRLRPNDGIGNGNYATSSAITIDYVTSTISNVSAVQNLGSTTVAITYDLFDNTSDDLTVEMQVSGDGGSTWTVPVTGVSGAIGSGQTVGNGKTITWNAGADYPNQQKSNLRVRIRARDKFQNQGDYTSSADFSLDTLPPATLAITNLLSQPNAGDSTALIGGSFTEVNPNSNEFFVAINGGGYSATTTGDTDTATPSNQNTGVGATLTGHDYISKVKILHTDDYGLNFANENTSPSSTLKYVKPYTPGAPILSNPVTTRLDLQINPHAGEASDVEYAIFEASTTKYVQSDGTLGNSPVWQVMGTASGQWGNGLGVSDKVRITGLSSPVSLYTFKVKSRNPSDSGHAASSESAWSATASIPNTAPVVALNSYTQTTDGTQYVNINYTGTDGQGDISNLITYEYSTDNSVWHTMTEKSGAGSNGTTNLVFLPTGSAYLFAWDSGVDLSNIEDSTVYARIKANDTQVDSNLAASSAFEIDNKAPIVSNLSASQTAGAKTVAISYDLSDANNSLVQIEISSDGGSSWVVATSTLSGAVGSNVTAGSGKTASWNAGVDFNNQYNTLMKVRVRARDTFGNQGSYTTSANFTLDTHPPVLNNVTAIQDSGANTFTFHYDVSEDIGNVNALLAVSSDGGSTWVVATTTATGDIGANITPGISKTITWNAGTDYNNQEKANMRIKVTATDGFSNSSNLDSVDFSLDTQAPRISSVSASQPLGGTNVIFTYDLADQNSSLVELDISSDGGSSWTVTDTSVSGHIGSGQTAGSKTITWVAATDFSGHDLSTMRVRIRANDVYNNQSNNFSSANFSIDTLSPAVLTTTDLKAQPLAGATSTLIGGSFTENNPNSNDFYVAINGGDYGSLAAGSINTATPSDKLVPIGVALDGNDYISKVRIIHTDDYNQSVINENLNPNISYRYVKPYTPAAPTIYNPAVSAVTVGINKNPTETDGLEYAIYEITSGKYVQSNGTLGSSPVWQVIGTGGVTEWGYYLSSAGQVRVTGLINPAYTYQFQVKSRNTSDASHAASSESALSSSASSANQSPTITINSVSQITSGAKYVTISYTGIDLESENASLIKYQYSTNGSTWQTMTEKGGVGSEGIGGLVFSNSGTSHQLMWDVGTDVNNIEDDTVYIRLQANDGTSDGGITASSAFTVDTKNPAISSVTASQDSNSNNVSINYNLSDLSNSTVEIGISSDGGSTWVIATSTATGDIGANVTPNVSKYIGWNPGVDYSGQENSSMRVQVRAVDNYGNIGSYSASSNFSIDTKAPVFANVSASQVVSSSIVRITYDISDANNSTVALDISSDGGSTWTVATTSLSGAIGSGVTLGTGKIIDWDAGLDFPNHQINNMQVRVRAVDTHANTTGNVTSNLFAINTQAPTITSVTASQVLGSDVVNIGYNLFDIDNVYVAIEISSDGGSTWAIATSTLSGDVGPNIAPGLAKSASWNAGINFNNQQNSNMKVRIRGTNAYGNTSANISLLGVFSVDTLAPATLATADLQAQPNAGDSTVLVGGSFTEPNPNFNYFMLAVGGGSYVATTTGEVNTASPANQQVAVGGTLTGHDYISKVKLAHLDDYGHWGYNENLSPNSAYKYVKPYTPAAPTVNNPQNTSIDLIVNPYTGEASDVEYAIYEVSTGKYVQSNGSLDSSPVWKALGVASGQWGNLSGVTGKIVVTGLTSPVGSYSFQVKSRNPSDASHAVSSESAWSAVGAITNTAPTISIVSVAQATSGSYALINYSGIDTQSDTNSLVAYEYSTNGLIWQAMTEKSGVGSEGASGLIFAASGSSHIFAWDIASDLPNQEQPTVYIRLKSNDGLIDSNLAVSSAFYIDTRGPIISNISVAQTPNSNLLAINYDLSDSSGSGNTVIIEISDDNGSTWTVPVSTLGGDVGAGVTAGVSRSVTWNAGTDFAGQENNLMKLRIRGTDQYGNIGSYYNSGNFSVDTKTPVISGISVVQASDSGNVSISYNLADNTAGGHLVEFEVSNNSGSTWTVATTTRSGDIGSGVATGAKNFIWNAAIDFGGQDLATMRVRIRARDYFGNQGSYAASSNFNLDTKAPVISSITANQNMSSSTVAISYSLDENSTITLDISNDGGSTWGVAKNSASGALGNVVSGSGKSINWNAGTDFGNQENSTMRVRLRGSDSYGNNSIYYESTDFSVDTAGPLGLISLNKFSTASSSVTLNWQANTDTHFNRYELWHGSNAAEVDSRTGVASDWSVADDAALSNPLTISTVISGISITNDYYVKIWAIDDYGNEVTVPAINIKETPVTPVSPPVVTAGGAALIPVDSVAPSKPILNPLPNLTRQSMINISGLAEPRSKIDLYDNGVLLARLVSLVNNSGLFSQTLDFSSGSHSVTARSIDDAGNSSEFSDPINFNIITTGIIAPIILSPQNNSNITDATPQIIGVAESNSLITLNIDGQSFDVTANNDGAWSFIIPTSIALGDGRHSITALATDIAGNSSTEVVIAINKISVPAITPITGGEVISIPAQSLITETTQAVELPGIPVPKVVAAGSSMTAVGDVLSFTGTSIPDTDVVVYIHSDQALIYRAHTDQVGNWKINHSQAISELSPGEHTIYAVTLDSNSKVKSRPSAVSSFIVKRNFWVMLFGYLNWRTTIITLVTLLLVILWLHRVRNNKKA